MSKVYVAGKYQDPLVQTIAGKYQDPLVQTIAADVEGQGHDITLKWWEEDVPKPYLEHISLNAPVAVKMVNGVCLADFLVLVLDDNLYGAMVEFGVALGRRIPVLLTAGPSVDPRQSVFFCHPWVTIVQPQHIATHITARQQRMLELL